MGAVCTCLVWWLSVPEGRQGLPGSIAERGRRGRDGEQAPSVYTLGLSVGLGLSLQLSWIRSSFAHHFARAGRESEACSVRPGQGASGTKGRARGMSSTVARENEDRDEEGLLSLQRVIRPWGTQALFLWREKSLNMSESSVWLECP